MPVYPTPTGNVPTTLTGNWTQQPMDPQTEAWTVQIITKQYGSAKGAEFQAWLTAALQQDPNLTPDEAVGIWLTGTALSGGIGATGAFLGDAANAAGAAAAKTGNDLNPLNKLTGWTHNVEQWIIRGFEMLLGIGLIVVALAKLASDTPVGRAAAKAGKAAAIL